MSITMQAESTEFLYVGITGTPPDSAEVAFLTAGSRPAGGDWSAAHLILDAANPLWDDAVASGAEGDYYVARLIGSFAGSEAGLVLAANDYQMWIRLTGATERPVRIAPVTLTIV